MSGPRTAVAALAVMLALGVTPALADDADIGREIYGEFCLNCKRRLEAIEISVFEATEDVAFCG